MDIMDRLIGFNHQQTQGWDDKRYPGNEWSIAVSTAFFRKNLWISLVALDCSIRNISTDRHYVDYSLEIFWLILINHITVALIILYLASWEPKDIVE